MEIESLKVEKFMEDIFDLIYPVGSYYETSNRDFNPNDSFYGTWVEDTIGYVTVGADTVGDSELIQNNIPSLDVGDKTGEMNHTLTVAEMPQHNHELYGTANPNTGGPAFRSTVNGEGNGMSLYTLGASSGNAGNGQSHNNMQPSIGVIRWHRTA